MKAVIYYTEIPEKYTHRNMEHMLGEKLLETGVKQEYGMNLSYEPRAVGEHGKPFFTLRPKVHYNISHSGKYIVCILTGQEVGIDIQIHKKVNNYERILERLVPAEMIREILNADEPEKAFFTQWVLREAYIKWTGEGLSRDLRTIPLNSGHYTFLDLDPGYSGAVWSADALEIEWKYVEAELP